MAPIALRNMPDFTQLQPTLIAGLIYLGMGSAGFGFLIMVYGLKKLGPTTSADFLPVSTAVFGWIFLRESLSPIQILGGVVVIAAGYIVIKEKGKLDSLKQTAVQPEQIEQLSE